MSKTLKIILGIVAGLVVLCAVIGIGGTFLVGRMAGNAFSTDKTQITTTAGNIATHTLPAGYEPAFSMDILGVKMAMFGNDANNGIIGMMAMPAGAGDADVERSMSQAMDRQTGNQKVTWNKSETKPITINGKEVSMKFSTGTDQKGNAMRQISGAFTGEKGLVGLFIIGADATWDQAAVDTFLASLK